MEDEKKIRSRPPSTTAGKGAGQSGTREPAGEVSRGKRGSRRARTPDFIRRLAGAGPLGLAVLALGLSAAVLMVATEFSTIHSVKIGESSCGAAEERLRDICHTSGGEQHNWSLLLLGGLAALLALGAAVGRSRPAALALGAVGLIVLGIALIGDRPTLDETRGLEVYYGSEGTAPQTGGGYTLELIAGALAVAAAGAALMRERAAPRRAAADGGADARRGGRRRGRGRRGRGGRGTADSAA